MKLNSENYKFEDVSIKCSLGLKNRNVAKLFTK